MPDDLFLRAEQYLLNAKVVLPGPSVMERLIISACSEVHERLFESLYQQLSEEIRQAIDELLIAASGDQRSLFFLLKEYPPSATIFSIQSYLERYRSLDGTGIDTIESRIADPAFMDYLYKLAHRYNAKDIKRFKENKRYFLMLCFLLETRKVLLDHLVKMHDQYVLDMLRKGKQIHEKKHRELCKRHLYLMAAQSPCFAMGYVEAQKEKCGFVAVRPETSIPNDVTQRGMNFGHSVLGTSQFKVLHFGFEFYDHATYHGLVPAGNPIIQAVISTMLDTQDYFFFAINPDQSVTAFRSQFEAPDLAGLKTNQEKFGEDTCSSEQYEHAVKTFTKNPDPPGKVMTWVCRNNWDYLDLKQYPLNLNPRP